MFPSTSTQSIWKFSGLDKASLSKVVMSPAITELRRSVKKLPEGVDILKRLGVGLNRGMREEQC